MRIAHILKKNEGVEVPMHYIFADTETTLYSLGNNVYQHYLKMGWGVYVRRQRRSGNISEKWIYFNVDKPFWDFVDKVIPEKSKLYLFFFNADFDLKVLRWNYNMERLGYDLKRLIWDNNRVILHFRKGTKTVVILDVMNFFKTSVKVLGESMGLEKYEVDFNNVDDETLKLYCRRDVEIIKLSILSLVDLIEKEQLGTFRPTIASLAYNIYKHKFMNHPIYIHNNENALTLERESYRGGRTEAFYIGEIKDKEIFKLDVNSLYPYIMRSYVFPVKISKIIYEPSEREFETNLERRLCIARCLITVKEPCIGVKRDRLIFPLGRFKAVLTSPEIDLVKKYGEIEEVYEALFYDSGEIFNDFIKYFYNKRMEYKEEGNVAFNIICKYIMNSLYGKFAQKGHRVEIIGEDSSNETRVEEWVDAESGEVIKYKYIGGKVIKETSKEVESFESFPAITSFITAYARCYMWDLMKICPGKSILYMDTDSLIVVKEGYEAIKEKINEKELGKLKLEETATYIKIRNLKDYVFGDKEVRKGIRKDAIEIAPNIYRQVQFEHLASAIKNEGIDKQIMKVIEKEIKGEYSKGIVTAGGWVEPFLLNER